MRRDPLVVAGLLLVGAFIIGGLAAPAVAPFDPNAVHPVDSLLGPTWEYPLGTDALGRDVLSRLLFGARWTLGLATLTTGAVMLIGVTAGAVAGYHGGWLDQAIMRVIDILMAFPNLILALAIAGVLGAGIDNVMIGLVAVWWVDYARIVRGLVLSLRESAFIEAAQSLGARSTMVVLRHVIPNVVPPVIVLATLELGTLILALAGLNFLGLGIQPPTPEWGAMINEARPYLTSAPHLMLFPGLAITLTVMGSNLLGDGLRDVLDPHLPRKHHRTAIRQSRLIRALAQRRRQRMESGEEAWSAEHAAAVEASTSPIEPLLSVRNLVTQFHTEDGVLRAVDGVSFDLQPGETLGIVGESGAGKSVTVGSILGLIPQPPGQVVSGQAWLGGQDLLRASRRQLRAARGKDIAMVSQDSMTSLNPVLSVGDQLVEAVRIHQRDLSRKDARDRAVQLLHIVGVPHAEARIDQYPHEYSGGMRQRAMIAMAIANQPRVLIADEPTTALDVTIQAQVLDVLRTVQRQTNASTLLITHDLGLIAEMADRVIVMYAGRVVEVGDVFTIFHEPRHPYTVGLMASLPRLHGDVERLVSIPGPPPSLLSPPSGCRFHPRCGLNQGRERCWQEEPSLFDTGGGHRSRCHFYNEVSTQAARLGYEPGNDFGRAGA